MWAVLTVGLKCAAGRERPNLESNTSFPSGHTSNIFTEVIAGHYYGWKAYVPRGTLAILVGLTRIDSVTSWRGPVWVLS